MAADWILFIDWADMSRRVLIACDWMAFLLLFVLMLSPAKFDKLNQALHREYGIKRRMLPWLEKEVFDFTPRSTGGKRALALALMLLLFSNIFYLTQLVL